MILDFKGPAIKASARLVHVAVHKHHPSFAIHTCESTLNCRRNRRKSVRLHVISDTFACTMPGSLVRHICRTTTAECSNHRCRPQARVIKWQAIMPKTLYYGDNLSVLRDHIPDESVDLVYLDPPFNSNASYNVLFKEQSGEQSPAQIKAFTDTWEWTQESQRTFEREIILNPSVPHNVKDMIQAFRQFIGSNAMMAYLVMMTPRLVELRRVLKTAGSIYLHCDPTASHYLKILMDTIFGKDRFLTEITWKRNERS